MNISDTPFYEEYRRIIGEMRLIEGKLKIKYTSDPNWLWLDGRKTAFEWMMRMEG